MNIAERQIADLHAEPDILANHADALPIFDSLDRQFVAPPLIAAV
jgi:hypothetical protein